MTRRSRTVMVLAGEQHLWDVRPDGSRGNPRVRRAGDYALTVGDEFPHIERGGDSGGVVFFGNHAADGRLYELYNDDLELVIDVTMQLLIDDWNENS